MSVDLDWQALTDGEDGLALAETIRAFIHDRFQTVTLPKMIRSVKVHSFDFGTVGPELELKDVCDPLPDFYDDGNGDDDDDEADALSPTQEDAVEPSVRGANAANTDTDTYSTRHSTSRTKQSSPTPSGPMIPGTGNWSPTDTPRPPLSRSSTPGIPGGTSNMSYFHLPLSAGLSGAATPFAAFGGAHGWLENQHSPWHHHELHHESMNSRLNSWNGSRTNLNAERPKLEAIPEMRREKASEDVQIVARVRYSGDVKLSMTADILLDYPMPSFVGIPLQLRVTGMTFDGVAIVAYIKKKAHFCFLSPEDADALLDGGGADSEEDDEGVPVESRKPVGGLFEQIRVESEIGQRTNGKQVLKNVGKVEKFVLEQVRKIFENEFVYPSFWTFLV